MQLEKGEQSILAYFPTSNQAQEAVEVLRVKGFETVQLDRISRYGYSLNDELNNPLNQASQANLVLFSRDDDEIIDDDARVLLGADPSISGVGLEDYGVAGGRSFLVTVVTGRERTDEAVRILEEHGAQV
jgi:hypothetical protein